VPYERTVDIGLTQNVTVRFSQSGRPVSRYSVALLLLVDGEWQTVRLYDNHQGTHHCTDTLGATESRMQRGSIRDQRTRLFPPRSII